MERLYELKRSGRKIADDEGFLSGNRTPNKDFHEPHLRETDLRANLELLEDKIDETMEKFEPGEAQIDAFLAPTVHKAIEFTPREAAREGIWHYLTIVKFSPFVRHRWPRDDTDRTKESMKEKFLGRHRDIYSNALHRLWWIAELTHDPSLDEEYKRTEQALRTQRLANTIFDRGFHRSSDVVQACVDLLADDSNDVIEKVTYRVNHGFSAVSLEAMPPEEIHNQIQSIREDVTS